MHIDARQLDNNTLIEGDICIIGAGAAGISMALSLENTALKVVLLEGGGMEYDDRVQELYNGKITGHPYYPMKASRLHYFGGSTGHWGGMCSTFDEIDFEKRDWVENSGWPITLKDISPFYPKAHEIHHEKYFFVNLHSDGIDNGTERLCANHGKCETRHRH